MADRRTLTLGMTAILIASILAGASTFAYFIDVETSTGNTFTAETLDLKVSDADDGFGDGVSMTWIMSNMEPGITTVGPLSVNLQSTGTISNHIEISFSHSIDEITNPVESDTNPASTAGEMARWIEITSMTYNGHNFANTYTDANGNGFFDLEDVTMSPYNDIGGPLDDLPVPIGGGTRSFTMALKFNAGATNDIQGDTLTTTVSFTLNQDSSQ